MQNFKPYEESHTKHRESGQPVWTTLPCGARAILDVDGCFGYRCQSCFAIWGSIGCPCSNEMEKDERK